jgi:general stress protein YciG
MLTIASCQEIFLTRRYDKVTYMASKKNPHAVALGQLGGKAAAKSRTPEERQEIAKRAGQVGGAARADKLSPKRRKEIAKKAAQARWGKKPSK